MALSDGLKPSDISLVTDLYELTMAQGFFAAGAQDTQAIFTCFFRENPFGSGFTVACGTAQIAKLVRDFRFSDDALSYLSSLKAPQGGKLFTKEFIHYLADFTPQLNIWVVPEGDLVFPREPLVRVEGPLIAAQLIETALLNLVNFQTLIATKAARVVHAAQGRAVSDFGVRRAQGPDGGLSATRACWVGGVTSTSNVLAGKVYGIPVFGTHAHSWVMSFPTQLEAFRAFAQTSPHNCVFLLDTYDTETGIDDAITVAKEMEARGEHVAAVRIDSGDLTALSKMVRAKLDAAGLNYITISVSNDLDEHTIESLLAQGAPIDAFGVGTKLVTADPHPALGGVYKLSAYRQPQESSYTPVMKTSEFATKRTIPGRQAILRYSKPDGSYAGDVIYDPDLPNPRLTQAIPPLDPDITYDFTGCSAQDVLVQVVEEGEDTQATGDLAASRARLSKSLAKLSPATQRFLNPHVYPVGLEPSLAELRSHLTHGSDDPSKATKDNERE